MCYKELHTELGNGRCCSYNRYVSAAVDTISHMVSTQPHYHLAGLADSYADKMDPDPVGKGERCRNAQLRKGGGWATSLAPQPVSSPCTPGSSAITVVGFVNLKLPPHPREGKAVTPI